MQQVDSAQAFNAAAAWLSAAPTAAALHNDLKLEIYGLYKILHGTAMPSGARPSIFYPAARAKHDAWIAQSLKYHGADKEEDVEAGRSRYIEVARQVGWAGQGLAEEEDVDFDDIRPSSSRAGGMGVRVSQMYSEEEEWVARQLGLKARQQSPIHDAVTSGSAERVSALLQHNPDLVHLRGAFGYTPLHLAADRGHIAVLKTLLEAGADPTAKDEEGQTPLQLAVIADQDDVVALLR